MAEASPIAVVAETALGFAGVALGPHGIQRATLFHPTRQGAEGELRAFGAVEGDHERSAEVVSLLQRYAEGERTALDNYPIDLVSGTELQRNVWKLLRSIPAGETRSYGWLAERTGLGRGGARAVGTINGENPIPLWLPCHRVIASDGTLGGFAGGLTMKTRLLELEGALPKRMI